MTTLQAIGFTIVGGAAVSVVTFTAFGIAVRRRSVNVAPRATARHRNVIYNPKAGRWRAELVSLVNERARVRDAEKARKERERRKERWRLLQLQQQQQQHQHQHQQQQQRQRLRLMRPRRGKRLRRGKVDDLSEASIAVADGKGTGKGGSGGDVATTNGDMKTEGLAAAAATAATAGLGGVAIAMASIGVASSSASGGGTTASSSSTDSESTDMSGSGAAIAIAFDKASGGSGGGGRKRNSMKEATAAARARDRAANDDDNDDDASSSSSGDDGFVEEEEGEEKQDLEAHISTPDLEVGMDGVVVEMAAAAGTTTTATTVEATGEETKARSRTRESPALVQDRGGPVLGWIPWTLSLSYDAMLRGVPGTGTRKKGLGGQMLGVNLDAVVLFRFHALCLRVTVLATLLCLCIVLPMNLTARCHNVSDDPRHPEFDPNCFGESYTLTNYEQTTLKNIPPLPELDLSEGRSNTGILTKYSLWVPEYSALLVRLYGIVICSWIVAWYTARLINREWKSALALRRVYYLEVDHWRERKAQLEEIFREDGGDSDESGDDDDDDDGDPLSIRLRRQRNSNVKAKKRRRRSYKRRDPWIPHPEQRDTVPSIELYSVLVGGLPALPSEVVDGHHSSKSDSDNLGWSRRQSIDWQLALATTFFDHCVPNQPGFSSSVAAVTVLPDAPELARAWRKWYVAAAALRRLRFIRKLIADRREYEVDDEDSDGGEEQQRSGGRIERLRSNSTVETDNMAAARHQSGEFGRRRGDDAPNIEAGLDAETLAARRHVVESHRRLKYYRDVFGTTSPADNDGETRLFRALDYGPEQSAVYSREFAQGAAACCPNGCREERLRAKSIDELLELEREAIDRVNEANLSLQYAQAQAAVSLLETEDKKMHLPEKRDVEMMQREAEADRLFRPLYTNFAGDVMVALEENQAADEETGDRDVGQPIHGEELSPPTNGVFNSKSDIGSDEDGDVKGLQTTTSVSTEMVRPSGRPCTLRRSVSFQPDLTGHHLIPPQRHPDYRRTASSPPRSPKNQAHLKSMSWEEFVLPDCLSVEAELMAKFNHSPVVRELKHSTSSLALKDSVDCAERKQSSSLGAEDASADAIKAATGNCLGLTDIPSFHNDHAKPEMVGTDEEMGTADGFEEDASPRSAGATKQSSDSDGIRMGMSHLSTIVEEGVTTFMDTVRDATDFARSATATFPRMPNFFDGVPPPPFLSADNPPTSITADKSNHTTDMGQTSSSFRVPSDPPCLSHAAGKLHENYIRLRDERRHSDFDTIPPTPSSLSEDTKYQEHSLDRQGLSHARSFRQNHLETHADVGDVDGLTRKSARSCPPDIQRSFQLGQSDEDAMDNTPIMSEQEARIHDGEGFECELLESALDAFNSSLEDIIDLGDGEAKRLQKAYVSKLRTTNELLRRRLRSQQKQKNQKGSNLPLGVTGSDTGDASLGFGNGKDSWLQNSSMTKIVTPRSRLDSAAIDKESSGTLDHGDVDDASARQDVLVKANKELESAVATVRLRSESEPYVRIRESSPPLISSEASHIHLYNSDTGPRRRRTNTAASKDAPSVQWAQVERIMNEGSVGRVADDDDDDVPYGHKLQPVTGIWTMPSKKSAGDWVLRNLTRTVKSAFRWATRKTAKAVDGIASERTFAVVTFTNRQAAVAARHCLADGRGAERWLTIEDVPVPPLADAAVCDMITCRGCCRPVTLSITKKQQMLRKMCAMVLLASIYLFYTLPISVASALADPTKLYDLIPGFQDVVENNVIFSKLLQGLVPALLYTTFFALCPLMFKAISNFGSNATSVNCAERSAIKYYWWFMLLTAFSGSSLMTMVLNAFNQSKLSIDFSRALIEIAGSIPSQVAATWINWIIVRTTMTLPTQYMLQINSFIFQCLGWKCCRRCVMGGGPGGPIPYRIYIDAGTVFMCVVALAPASPLVAPCALCYFLYCTPLWRRNCIFIYRPKFDTGGMRWPFLTDILISSTVAAQILLTTMMFLKKAVGPSLLAAIPIIPTLMFRSTSRHRYLRAYRDAGLLQTSLLDGWDNSVPVSMEKREEFRQFLVDAHKAAYIPICIAGGATSVLTAEPAVVVPLSNSVMGLSALNKIEGTEQERLPSASKRGSTDSPQYGASLRRLPGKR